MLLSELHEPKKELRSWREVSAAERAELFAAFFKTASVAHPTSGEELEKWFIKKGVNANKRSIDKELEKDQYRKYDKHRARGTAYSTQLKNKGK